jgi:hypothetical protein
MDRPDLDALSDLFRIYSEGLPPHLREQFGRLSMREMVALSLQPDHPLVRELSEEARQKFWVAARPFLGSLN